MNIEYESGVPYDLRGVAVAIPLPHIGHAPQVNQVRVWCGWRARVRAGVCVAARTPCVHAHAPCTVAWCARVSQRPAGACNHPRAPAALPCRRPSRPAPAAALSAQADGDWRYDSRRNALLWSIDLIDDTNRSGSLEFVVPACDPDTFYPIEVSFSSAHTFCDIGIEAVRNTQSGEAVKYGTRCGMSTASYQVA